MTSDYLSLRALAARTSMSERTLRGFLDAEPALRRFFLSHEDDQLRVPRRQIDRQLYGELVVLGNHDGHAMGFHELPRIRIPNVGALLRPLVVA